MEFSRQECWRGLPFPSPGDPTCVSCISCTGRQVLYQLTHRKPQYLNLYWYIDNYTDTVQETGIKTIPKKKKCKKAKWMSEEALQIAVKIREVKSKGEKERYTHLNAEVQRIARRDKKAFLSDQCKEIEENNRMGKTRDLFKKIRDGNISCKDGLNKGQKWYGPNRSRRY